MKTIIGFLILASLLLGSMIGMAIGEKVAQRGIRTYCMRGDNFVKTDTCLVMLGVLP